MTGLTRHIRLPRPAIIGPTFAQLRRGAGDPTHRQVGDMYLRATRTPAGPDGVVEIGYTVVPAWRGRGVASRACGLIVEQAWRDGAEIVIAETDDDNVASQAVLLRNGFQRRPDGVFMIKRPEAR